MHRAAAPFFVKTARLSWATAVLLLVSACSSRQQGASPPRVLSANDNPTDQLAAPPIENVQAPITHVERGAVDEAVTAGVARFIQGFDMVEELDEYDRFVGWKIGKIHDRSRFEGLGIGSGDVITSINGLPLERPAHAYEVLMSLKTAQSIDVEYLRGGRVMRLSLPIIGESSDELPGEKPQKAPEAKEEKKAEAPSESEKTASEKDSVQKKKPDAPAK